MPLHVTLTTTVHGGLSAPFGQGGVRGPEAWAIEVTASRGESGWATPESGVAWSLRGASHYLPPPTPSLHANSWHSHSSFKPARGGSRARPARPGFPNTQASRAPSPLRDAVRVDRHRLRPSAHQALGRPAATLPTTQVPASQRVGERQPDF